MSDEPVNHESSARHVTGHSAVAFVAERQVYESMVHYVNGRPVVGGGGYPLSDLLRSSWHREADSLLDDLDVIGRAVVGDSPDDALELVRRIEAAADRIRHAATGRPEAAWSADYRDGGRPITGETTEVQDAPEPASEDDVPDPPDLGALADGKR